MNTISSRLTSLKSLRACRLLGARCFERYINSNVPINFSDLASHSSISIDKYGSPAEYVVWKGKSATEALPKELWIKQENENNYISKYIDKQPNSFADMGNMVDTLPIYPDLLKLEALVKTKNLSETNESDYKAEFTALSDSIRNHIRLMNQRELAIFLTAIKNHDREEFRAIKKILDIELRWLLKKHVKTRLMDLDLWLYLADVFYESRIRSKFVHVLVNYLANEKDVTMTNRQFLHLLFLVILQRNQNGILSKYEERIIGLLNKASFEDIAIICLAYFKTKTIINNPEILRRIIDRTTDSLGTLDPEQPGYCAVIKALRYARNLDVRENILHLTTSLTENLNDRIIFSSPYNAVHTIKLMESYRIYDPKLLNMFRSAMFQNLQEFRIKDIQYALTSLSNFAYMDLKMDEKLKLDFDRLCDYIVSEIREDVSMQYFHLMPILRAFSIFGYYNDDLLSYTNRLMSDPSKIRIMSKVLEFNRSALLAYVAAILEGGKDRLRENSHIFKMISKSIDRAGNFGSVKQDTSLNHLNFILHNGKNRNYYVKSKLFREIAVSLSTSSELQGEQYKFNFQYTFPHQNYADLVISKNQQAPGSFHPTSLLPALVSPNERHCLIYTSQRTDFVDGHNRLSGYKQLVNRLMTRLGYRVLHVDLYAPNIDNLAHKVKIALD